MNIWMSLTDVDSGQFFITSIRLSSILTAQADM